MVQPTNMQMPKNLNPQAGGPNAVSINIYNPQAYGSAPEGVQQAQCNYTNSLYQMPQGEIYNTQSQTQTPPAQYYIPQTSPQTQAATQPIVAPAPQMMPDSVIPAQQQTEQTPPENTANTEEAKATQETENKEAVTSVDTESLIKDLKSNDAKLKSDAINKLAEYAQDKPEIALQVVSEPVMQALVDVIKEDTSNLEGPTDKQVEIAEKISKQEQLTPEEEELSNQLSPRDTANKNRIFALYTLAMIQKLQRDELNQYIETQKANGEKPIDALKLEDLVGYEDVVNTIKNDSRPEVKVAAIQALEHVAEMDDKAKVEEILADALKSKDEPVKTAAQEALAKFQAQ